MNRIELLLFTSTDSAAGLRGGSLLPHLFMILMNSHDDMGTGCMPDEPLLDESLTLFLAGHETTANALTWAWFLLAQHPEVKAMIRRELDKVLGGRLPTLDDVPHYP